MAASPPAYEMTGEPAGKDKEAALHHLADVDAGLQAPSPDTLLQSKQAEAPRKFGVTQGAHVAGGLLILGGGVAVISGANSDSTGYYPLVVIGFGIILAVIGGAMLLFKGKTARRRQKQA